MRSRLLASYLGLSAVAAVLLFGTVRITAPNFFDHHIGSMAFMSGPGGAGMTAEASRIDDALARSLNEGFLVAAAVGLPLAVLASVIVARQVPYLQDALA